MLSYLTIPSFIETIDRKQIKKCDMNISLFIALLYENIHVNNKEKEMSF